jgi:hypothetical protein
VSEAIFRGEATVYGAEAGKAFRRSPQRAKQQIVSEDAPGVVSLEIW